MHKHMLDDITYRQRTNSKASDPKKRKHKKPRKRKKKARQNTCPRCRAKMVDRIKDYTSI